MTTYSPAIRAASAVLTALVAAAVAGGCTKDRKAAGLLAALEDDYLAGRATPEESLLLAKNRIIARRFDAALSLLDGLRVPTARLEAHRQVLRGMSFEGLTRYGDAHAAYDAALTAAPDDPTVLLRQGVLAYHMGDLWKAELYLARAAATMPGNAEAHCYLYTLATSPQDRARELAELLRTDGPNGPWARKALMFRKR